MRTLPKLLCWMVSALGLSCAAVCFWYTGLTALRIAASPSAGSQPGFLACYVILSAAATLIGIGTAVGSVELALLRARGARVLAISSLMPILLMIIVTISWLLPGGSNMAAATGVGLGGVLLMIVTFLPVWAGLLCRFAFREHLLPRQALF